ncbi:Lipoprotein signal peptidase [Desulfosarcina cetonica]|uniref:signal peptidase II n=1 Tax=Desulfosarcina cetonica TaxID=90730 RepID=UPI000AA382C1|nr:signal peptidase II [Desulfosarcina cetonica]VTR68164.1 Lipoprotein signal peptidase [Desulfosarcina cetonica]
MSGSDTKPAPSGKGRERSGSKGASSVRAPSMGARAFMVIAAIVVVLDQITKQLILDRLPLYQRIEVIPGFFNLTHIHNPGGAFGFMAAGHANLRNLLFIGVATLAMGMIIYFYRLTPKTRPFLASALAMIFGGAVGNLIDRLRFGEVIDFLDFYVGAHHWPAFNVADSAITIGITIFIAHVVLGKMPD